MRALIRMYTPDGELVAVPVTSEEQGDRLRVMGWKPAESYAAAKKRNFPVLEPITFAGSVRFSGHRARY